jgi:hypothetical protein
MLRLGGGKLAAIGQQRSAQPGDPALPCCLARFVDAAPPWRPAHDQENRKIRLAEEPPFAAPPPAPLALLAHRSAINSRALPIGLLGPAISRGVVGVLDCGHCVLCGAVLFPLQRRDDSHVQHASLHPDHECAHHLCQRQS